MSLCLCVCVCVCVCVCGCGCVVVWGCGCGCVGVLPGGRGPVFMLFSSTRQQSYQKGSQRGTWTKTQTVSFSFTSLELKTTPRHSIHTNKHTTLHTINYISDICFTFKRCTVNCTKLKNTWGTDVCCVLGNQHFLKNQWHTADDVRSCSYISTFQIVELNFF